MHTVVNVFLTAVKNKQGKMMSCHTHLFIVKVRGKPVPEVSRRLAVPEETNQERAREHTRDREMEREREKRGQTKQHARIHTPHTASWNLTHLIYMNPMPLMYGESRWLSMAVS